MPKVFLYQNDTFRLHVDDASEAKIKYFFEEENLNAEISQDLLNRYKTIEKEFQTIQNELRLIFNKLNSSD